MTIAFPNQFFPLISSGTSSTIWICNIYATNDNYDREKLWDWMIGSLPKEYWIIVGDFNMIEFWDNECGVVKNTCKGS